ncbi:MAG: cytochrome P450 [Coleofasciculus sp. B1-GNL1-01]|uniref:cytochrome P450 n=1 Tax=Coleofasciculus sp. B1-GNL1-01 TaxID=3068484 RepID=UPI0032FC2EED
MKLPDGPTLPFFVQTLQLIADPLKFLDTCTQRYGDAFTLRLLGRNSPPVVFFSHPQAIQSIFTTSSDKFELGKVTDVFRPLTGSTSLIMLDGQQHQVMRGLLMPPLHGKRLPTYSRLIRDIATDAIADWQPGSSLRIRDYMSEISLQVILRVVFGLNVGDRYDRLKQLIEPFLNDITSPLNSIHFFWTPLQQDWGGWSPWGKFVRQRQQIDDLIYEQIAHRRTQPEGDDILSLLMSAHDQTGQSLTDVQLRDQLITLLLLGHETTASALAWAFYWLHRQPLCLEKVTQELDSLGENPDPDAIAQLPYLTAVCKEALRVYPIALIAQPRQVKASVQIQGYELEPGAIAVPCIYLTHRRQDVYPEPDQFKPERFLHQQFSSYEYFPFGGGSRSCIGMALSLFEMKLVLATVLSRYQLAIAPNTSVQPWRRGITIVPSQACPMVVKTQRHVHSSREKVISYQ